VEPGTGVGLIHPAAAALPAVALTNAKANYDQEPADSEFEDHPNLGSVTVSGRRARWICHPALLAR
jgi:hypothetical protein